MIDYTQHKLRGWELQSGKPFKIPMFNFLAVPASCCQDSKCLESFRGVRTPMLFHLERGPVNVKFH